MGFKQPRVPEYREAEGVGHYMRNLTLFLKDFCMDSWKTVKNLEKYAALKCYPVGSVYTAAQEADPGRMFGGEWEAVDAPDAALYMWKRVA